MQWLRLGVIKPRGSQVTTSSWDEKTGKKACENTVPYSKIIADHTKSNIWIPSVITLPIETAETVFTSNEREDKGTQQTKKTKLFLFDVKCARLSH